MSVYLTANNLVSNTVLYGQLAATTAPGGGSTTAATSNPAPATTATTTTVAANELTPDEIAALPPKLRKEAEALVKEIKILTDLKILVQTRNALNEFFQYLGGTFAPQFDPLYEKALIAQAKALVSKNKQKKITFEKAQAMGGELVADPSNPGHMKLKYPDLVSNAENDAISQMGTVPETLEAKLDACAYLLRSLTGAGVYPEAKTHYAGHGIKAAGDSLSAMTTTLEQGLLAELSAETATPTGELAIALLKTHNPGFDPAQPNAFNALTPEGVQKTIDALGIRLTELKNFSSVTLSAAPLKAKPGETVQIAFTAPAGQQIPDVVSVEQNLFYQFAIEGKNTAGNVLTSTELKVPEKIGKHSIVVNDAAGQPIGSFTFEVVELTGLEKFADFLYQTETVARLQLSLPVISQDKNKEAAVESVMPYTLAFELGMDLPIVGPYGFVESDMVKWTLSPELNYAQNIHLKTDDSYLLNPAIGTKLQITPKVAKPYIAGKYSFTHEKFRNPTLFYPNANDHTFRAEGGVEFDIYQKYLTLTPYGGYQYSILNHEYPNVIADAYSFKGEEESAFVGAQMAIVLRGGKSYLGFGEDNPDGSEGSWVPNFGFYFDTSIKGKTHIPNTLKIGDEIIWDMQKAMGFKEWTVGGAIDFHYLTISGMYEKREVSGWPAEQHAAADLQIRLGDFGKYGGGRIDLGYDYYNVNPTAPITMHQLGATYHLPFLNEAIGIGGYGFFGDVKGGGATLTLDIPNIIQWASGRTEDDYKKAKAPKAEEAAEFPVATTAPAVSASGGVSGGVSGAATTAAPAPAPAAATFNADTYREEQCKANAGSDWQKCVEPAGCGTQTTKTDIDQCITDNYSGI